MKTEITQMAIETRTELKARVTANKLEAQLLTNMIDSSLLSYPDHNNLTSIQGGAAGDYNHLTTAQVALVDDTAHNSLTSKQGGASADYNHLTTAQVNLVDDTDHNNLTNIDGGTAGEYNHMTDAEYANVDIWVKVGTDRVLYSGATELQRVDEDGNIAYNGATMPAVGATIATLSSAFMYEFYPGNRVVETQRSGSKEIRNNQNIFTNGLSSWTYIATSTATLKVTIGDGRSDDYTLASGTAGTAAEAGDLVNTRKIDVDGTLHLPFAVVVDL